VRAIQQTVSARAQAAVRGLSAVRAVLRQTVLVGLVRQVQYLVQALPMQAAAVEVVILMLRRRAVQEAREAAARAAQLGL
jgi:hypothetical protein